MTARSGGLFSHGNRNDGNTAPERGLWDWASELAVRADFAVVVDRPAPKLDRSGWRTADEKLRRGRVCPGCGLEAPLSGPCNSCW